jgi:outer membrane protein OmpA-like peptidoglycan-associated protein
VTARTRGVDRIAANACAAALVAVVMTGRALNAQPAETTAQTKAMIAEVVRTGSVIVSGITFEKGRDVPAQASERSLDALRAMLAEHDEWTFEVQVHTAETGDPSRDETVSAARAKSVAAWLTGHGIASRRLVPRGFGSSRPLTRPADGEGRLVHDRVELRKLNEE